MFDFIHLKQQEHLTELLSFTFQDISHKMVTALINSDTSVERIKNTVLENSEGQEDLLKQILFITSKAIFGYMEIFIIS